MKRKVLSLLLAASLITVLMPGCQNAKSSREEEVTTNAETMETTEGKKESRVITPGYITITEAQDWGPAITKVILNMGVAVDGESLSTETFSVSSERKYTELNWKTFESEDVDSIEERTISNLYVSDAGGNPDKEGTYITIEMEIGPELTAGSPFHYDMSAMKNVYVDTDYLISVNEDKTVKDITGNVLTIEKITGADEEGNVNVLGDLFDVSGTYAFENAGKTIDLSYASYVPDENAKEASTPLIIWLHGAGEGGTDPTISIMGNKVVNLATDEIQQYFGETGAEILAPQCRTMWMDVDGTGIYSTDESQIDTCDGKSYYTEALKGLIDEYIIGHPEVDTSRIYIGGCSNGGYMTVNMLINYPDFFAAAYPVCEAYSVKWLSEEKIADIKDIPIWLTAAKTDGTVPVYKGTTGEDYASYILEPDDNGEAIPLDDYSNALYDRLMEANARDVHYSLFEKVTDTGGNYFEEDGTTPYEYMGHWSWIYTLNNECTDSVGGKEMTIFEWLSMQVKN